MEQGEKSAKLDHGISWNFPLVSPKAIFNNAAHQWFDHAVLSFGLPVEEFATKPQPARKPLAPTDRIDAVFPQNHIREWQEAVQNRMLPTSEETHGDALMSLSKTPSEFSPTWLVKFAFSPTMWVKMPFSPRVGTIVF